jgi:hypothetical protein
MPYLLPTALSFRTEVAYSTLREELFSPSRSWTYSEGPVRHSLLSLSVAFLSLCCIALTPCCIALSLCCIALSLLNCSLCCIALSLCYALCGYLVFVRFCSILVFPFITIYCILIHSTVSLSNLPPPPSLSSSHHFSSLLFTLLLPLFSLSLFALSSLSLSSPSLLSLFSLTSPESLGCRSLITKMGEVSYQRPEEIIDGKTFPEQVRH